MRFKKIDIGHKLTFRENRYVDFRAEGRQMSILKLQTSHEGKHMTHKIYGIDFISAPNRSKKITCAECDLEGDRLVYKELVCFTEANFADFREFLAIPGPWIAGMDFPFGQPATLIKGQKWPETWIGYVTEKCGFDENTGKIKQSFVNELRTLPKAKRFQMRDTDKIAKSQSPMKLDYIPVGRMFCKGAKLLLDSGVCVMPCRPNGDSRIAVEAYPKLVKTAFIKDPKKTYKSDSKIKPGQKDVRRELLQLLQSGTQLYEKYGLSLAKIDQSEELRLIDDSSGDRLDALLCAIQAAWAFLHRDENYGIPHDNAKIVDIELEGWIVDPLLCKTTCKSEH
jgi:hypothetical protein